MRIKYLLVLSSMVLFLQGLVLLVRPAQIIEVLQMPPGSSLMTQLFGLVLWAFALVNWLARNNNERRVQAIVTGNFIYYLMGTCLLVFNLLNGETTPFIMISIVLFFLMATLFVFAFLSYIIWNHLLEQLP